MTIIEVAMCCKALSDENRLSILKMLTKGEKCACSLLDELKVTQPTLSHHMKVLVESEMVNARKEGKWQYYSINCSKLSEFKEFISSITCCEKAENSTSRNCCQCNCQEK